MIIARAPQSISGRAEPTFAALPRVLVAGALLIGIAGWIHYLRQDLVLSHYDAKAHLVVARRVIDNITPGWRQLGAVWLPLPHLLQLLPTQIDLFYRTGAFGSFLSIACYAITTWAAARSVLLMTGSALGAATASALFALNPNLLYLHVTPMTEPLALTAMFLVMLWLYEWVSTGSQKIPLKLGCALFAAAWTRYEAWAFLCATLGAAAFAMWRTGTPIPTLTRQMIRLAAWPATAGLLFTINSRLATGSWFAGSEFYVPDPYYHGRGWRTLVALWWGTHRLSGYVVEIIALMAAGALFLRGLVRRSEASLLLALGFFATAAVPFVAFYQGHPYRMRYMVPLVAACALCCGLAVGILQRGWKVRWPSIVLCGALLASTIIESPVWSMRAALLEEAQWDVPVSRERQQVTRCLAGYRDEKILASMGSLAHYMQELSRQGFDIADFLHEGNGSLWEMALETGPAQHVGWMLVEEKAENGDVLARRIASDATFTRGMTRVCEGGGVALFRNESLR